MNTKHTRVVVTLFLTFATLATIGFRASNDHLLAVSILPDVDSCDLTSTALTAMDLLKNIDGPCYAGYDSASDLSELSKHVYSGYDYNSVFDLSKQESPANLIRPWYDYDSAFDLSKHVYPGYGYDSAYRTSDLPKQELLSKHVYSGYDYDSVFDLAKLSKQEALSDLIRPGYDYGSAFVLSEPFVQEAPSKHVYSGYDHDLAYDTSELVE